MQRLEYLLRAHLPVQALGEHLHRLRELHQHGAGQQDAEAFLEHEADAALAGLAVDAHGLLVGAADVRRVDRQVRHFPVRPVHPRHALADGVLVRSRERREDQIPGVGVAFVNGELVDGFDGLADARHVAEVELRVDALGEQVHRHRHEVAVAGAFAVAEQRAFHPLGAGHQRQFGGRDAGATVVVRVQADHHPLAFGEVADEPLDLIGVDVRRRHLHGRRQVDDDRRLRRGAPLVRHRGADVDGEVQLGAGEALGRVLEGDVGAGEVLDALLDHAGAFDGEVDDAGAVHVEDYPALQLGGGVVEVEDGVGRALQGFHGALDEFRARLAEHLDGHVVGHHAALDDAADEVVVGLRGGGKSHFDLDEAHLQQQLEQAQLFVHVHRIDQRLVAVAQVDAAPARRRVEYAVRPLPVGQVDRREGMVLAARHGALAAADPGRRQGGILLLHGHR